MRQLTFSRAGIARNCRYFLRDDVPWSDKGSAAADVGSAVHACAERIISGELVDVGAVCTEFGVTEDDRETVRNMVATWAEYASKFDTGQWMVEVKLAYDPASDTARVLTSKGPRDYSEAMPWEVAGTADLVMVRRPDVFVWDYKTGGGDYVFEALNTQLRWLFPAAARAFECTDGGVGVLKIAEGDVRPIDELMGESDLIEVRDEIREVFSDFEDETKPPEPKPGRWCKYCPAKACPESEKAVDSAIALVPDAALVRKPGMRLKPEIDNDEHARWSMAVIALARSALDHVEGAIRDYAKAGGGFETGNGMFYSVKNQSTRSLDSGFQDLVVILNEAGLGSAAEVKVSMASIERAAAAIGDKKRAEEVIGRLERLGVITRKEVPMLKERRIPIVAKRKGAAA